MLANPFPPLPNLTPHFCFHLRCLPLSFSFDHFALTLEFPSSRATRHISDPSIVQGPRYFPYTAFPISRNEGTRLKYKRSISRVPLGTRFELLFERKEKATHSFWTEEKEMKVSSSSLQILHNLVFFIKNRHRFKN